MASLLAQLMRSQASLKEMQIYKCIMLPLRKKYLIINASLGNCLKYGKAIHIYLRKQCLLFYTFMWYIIMVKYMMVYLLHD